MGTVPAFHIGAVSTYGFASSSGPPGPIDSGAYLALHSPFGAWENSSPSCKGSRTRNAFNKNELMLHLMHHSLGDRSFSVKILTKSQLLRGLNGSEIFVFEFTIPGTTV